jgi:hypothetical protein
MQDVVVTDPMLAGRSNLAERVALADFHPQQKPW